MKYVKHLPSFLLGALMLFAGGAFLLGQMPEEHLTGDSLTYLTLMRSSGYMTFVKVLEVICGVLLLVPQTRAFGLVVVAPICVNIMAFELFIAKQPGIGIALVVVNIIGLIINKDRYKSIFARS
jgi:putative oxidoreductase